MRVEFRSPDRERERAETVAMSNQTGSPDSGGSSTWEYDTVGILKARLSELKGLRSLVQL